jgi:hypothetical protein
MKRQRIIAIELGAGLVGVGQFGIAPRHARGEHNLPDARPGSEHVVALLQFGKVVVGLGEVAVVIGLPAGRRSRPGAPRLPPLLEEDAGIEVVGEASDGHEAVRRPRACIPTWW